MSHQPRVTWLWHGIAIRHYAAFLHHRTCMVHDACLKGIYRCGFKQSDAICKLQTEQQQRPKWFLENQINSISFGFVDSSFSTFYIASLFSAPCQNRIISKIFTTMTWLVKDLPLRCCHDDRQMILSRVNDSYLILGVKFKFRYKMILSSQLRSNSRVPAVQQY